MQIWRPPMLSPCCFDQREAIDEAVDRMAENMGPKPAIFFVGFAGVSSQRVFAQEIKLAAQVVGNRFDAAERELLLINDRRDFDTYPLATLSGLQYALSAVAQKMDPDRDILFLRAFLARIARPAPGGLRTPACRSRN